MPKGNLNSLLLLCISVLVEGTVEVNPQVVIDGYTVDSTITSPATLPLGRTALLVCRVSGIPHGQHTTYQWTCPNQPCLQAGFAGRKINNNIIAINTTSTSDGGTYTCTVTAAGVEGRQDFTINIEGGAVAHSYGRLMAHNEFVITDIRQLQPPNDDTGDGRVECTISSGTIRFGFSRWGSRSTQKATAAIPINSLGSFTNIEGDCGALYLYLFLKESNGFPEVRSATLQSASTHSITANLGFTPDSEIGIVRVITGYHRLDLGHEMLGQFHNNDKKTSATYSGLVPGARYRITAWGLGGANRKRGSAPAVLKASTQPSVPSPPRAPTITRDFQDGIELNWLPPRVTNGDIQHYIIRYTPLNGTEQEITTTDNTNYYNLTGLERGQTYYNFIVKAVNLAHTSAQSDPIGSYSHNPASPDTPTTKSATSTAAASTTTPINGCAEHGPTGSSTAIIIGATTANLLILLLSITLLVISGVLIVQSRKRRTSTLHSTSQGVFDEDSKEPAVKIYDEVDDSVVTTSKPTGVYQDLNTSNMDASKQYATITT